MARRSAPEDNVFNSGRPRFPFNLFHATLLAITNQPAQPRNERLKPERSANNPAQQHAIRPNASSHLALPTTSASSTDSRAASLSPEAQRMQHEVRVSMTEHLDRLSDQENLRYVEARRRARREREVRSDLESLEILERETARLIGCSSPFRPTLWRQPSRRTATTFTTLSSSRRRRSSSSMQFSWSMAGSAEDDDSENPERAAKQEMLEGRIAEAMNMPSKKPQSIAQGQDTEESAGESVHGDGDGEWLDLSGDLEALLTHGHEETA